MASMEWLESEGWFTSTVAVPHTDVPQVPGQVLAYKPAGIPIPTSTESSAQ